MPVIIILHGFVFIQNLCCDVNKNHMGVYIYSNWPTKSKA